MTRKGKTPPQLKQFLFKKGHRGAQAKSRKGKAKRTGAMPAALKAYWAKKKK